MATQRKAGDQPANMDAGARAGVQGLVRDLGSNVVTALLGISRDKLSRWLTGQETLNGDELTKLADLHSLVGPLYAAFTPAQAVLWLNGHDPYLAARPIDVFRLEGAAPVVEAIRAQQQGAFA